MMTRGKGVFGGTFDPIHLGHQDVVVAARTALSLATVLLVPSRQPPHRSRPPVASAADRLKMVELAASQDPRLEASDVEVSLPDPSYTSRTLDVLTRHGSATQFFFITGADAFAEISTWHDYPAVLDRSHFIVVSRPGHPAAALRRRLPELAARMREPDGGIVNDHHPGRPWVWLVDAETRDISSSDIRRRIRRGDPIDALVLPSVADYIRRHQLYGHADAALQPR